MTTLLIVVMREGFIGVHIGAGQHSELRTKLYLEICAQACAVGVEMLKSGGSAVDAACAATMVLEDAGETNAGYGSNLTESGTVEMGETIILDDIPKDENLRYLEFLRTSWSFFPQILENSPK